jgi:hypothetical protein
MSEDSNAQGPQAPSNRADELTDKLVERRERLAYFLITSATAIIAFTVTQLGQTDGPLRGASIPWLAAGWAGLLLSAGASLLLIWYRHESYSLYLDELYGHPISKDKLDSSVKRVVSFQWIAIGLFFTGSVIEFSTWAVALSTKTS